MISYTPQILLQINASHVDLVARAAVISYILGTMLPIKGYGVTAALPTELAWPAVICSVVSVV